MGEFRMPSLGADMVAGTLTEWYKHPGDEVHRGDIIAAVDTDKGSIDVEVFEDGVLQRLLVEEGRKVPVGTPLAVIGAGEAAPAAPPSAVPGAGEAPVAPAPAATPQAVGAPAPPSPPEAVVVRAPAPKPAVVRASPLARRMAADLGVDLSSLTGSGPGGAVLKADVEAARGGGERHDRMRRAIAAAMAKSNREIPHFYLASTIDFGAASAWLERWNAGHKPAERLLPAVLLLKAAALALREFPELNARWENDSVRPAGEIHVGMATSLRSGGLVIPAVHHADRRSLAELMGDVRELVQRARSGTLRSSDLTDGTVTVTSLGERGADVVFGVIYPPQTALIGFGTPVQRPWVVEGEVVPRPVVTVSLAADHRASDGHRGALFLDTLARLLQQPEEL